MKILLAADGSAHIRRAVNYVCKHLRTLDPDFEMHLRHAQQPLPGRAICEYAKKGKFDFVVMGSHGNGALLDLVLGSVESKVLANCDVPALIVR